MATSFSEAISRAPLKAYSVATFAVCMLVLLCDGMDAQLLGIVAPKVIEEFGKLDVLVNNAAEQHPQDDITDISPEQLRRASIGRDRGGVDDGGTLPQMRHGRLRQVEVAK